MRVVVKMRNGSLLRREGEQSFQQATFERYSFVIEVGNPWDGAELSRKRVREMTLSEIGQQVQILRSAAETTYEHWSNGISVALPVSCLVLVCVGAPIGGLNRRTGRLGGFAISAGGLLLYYIVVTAGSAWPKLAPFHRCWAFGAECSGRDSGRVPDLDGQW